MMTCHEAGPGLGCEVFDTFVWATGPDSVELVDGDYVMITPPVNGRLHLIDRVPPDPGASPVSTRADATGRCA